MESSPEVDLACAEYMKLAATLLADGRSYDCMPMKDRDVFDFLGFE